MPYEYRVAESFLAFLPEDERGSWLGRGGYAPLLFFDEPGKTQIHLLYELVTDNRKQLHQIL